MSPLASIIVIVRDQASRLALTLLGLERQDAAPGDFEIIVVDDDSGDGGVERALRIAGGTSVSIETLTCKSHGCRGIPRNVGAARARGELLVFLDADACPGRGLVRAHCQSHLRDRSRVALGDCHVIRGTERLLDPTDGTPFPSLQGQPLPDDPQPLVLSRARFQELGEPGLAAHAEKGIYPGMRRRHELLETMLSRCSSFAWAGVVPHNLSLSRATFDALGGFSTELAHAEGWDLGVRARSRGYPLTWIPGARSYHLYHARSVRERAAVTLRSLDALRSRHPEACVGPLFLWWAAMDGDPLVPPELRLNDPQVLEDACADRSSRTELEHLFTHYRRARGSLDDWLRGCDLLVADALRNEREPSRLPDSSSSCGDR